MNHHYLDRHTAKDLLKLQQMEKRFVEAAFNNPSCVDKSNEQKIRYALNLAKISTFQPGAAGMGRNDRPDITVENLALVNLRNYLIDTLGRSLAKGKPELAVLIDAQQSIPLWEDKIEPTVQAILQDHSDDFSAEELNREIGTKTLVNVCGGGGGSGYVYIGAYEALEQASYIPGYLLGASIGSVLGLFRSKHKIGNYDEDVKFAQSLSPGEIFNVVSLKARFGLPGLLRFYLHAAIQDRFVHPDGSPMLLSDLEIPFETVVAGVNRGAMGFSPEEYAREHHLILDKMPSKMALGRKITAQLIRMLAFINPMVTKEIIIGGDSLTADFNAVDAAGFSSAIPGILHYDIARNDDHMTEMLEALFMREDLMCLVDGGIINNVPVRSAWNQVHNGKIGTRNCYYLGFDCFHPQLTLNHALTLPVEYALQTQVAVNHPFAHNIIKFKPTLAPANLVPSAESIDKSYGWGFKQMNENIPLTNKFFETVEWPES